MTPLLFYGENDLHLVVIETFYACDHVTETFGDDHKDITGYP